MNHWNDFITRPPTLDRWELVRTQQVTDWTHWVTITITGWCERKRRPLWQHSEEVDIICEPNKVADIVHHLTLVCEQDRPTTNVELRRGLLGEYWDQPELPF